MDNLAPRPFRFAALWTLLAASLIMTLPALQGALLGYDDVNLIEAAGVAPGDFFTGLYYYAYTPFYGLSYWLDMKVSGGINPAWLHFVNVLWHAAAGYALFCLLLRLLENRVGAFFGALLFVLHPMHVESVSWIAGRKELVSAFFLFLAWLWHLRAEERGVRAEAFAVLFFLVACFTKASAVVLPGMLLAAAWLLPRYAGRRRLAAFRTLPLFLAALLPVIVHMAVGVEGGIIREVSDLGQRTIWWAAAWGDSTLRALVPFGLSIDYPEVRSTGWAWTALLPVAALFAMFALRRREPYLAFGIAAFFVALAPFNNIFPATDVLAADRYLYLSLFGLAIAGGWIATRGPRYAVATAAVCALYLGLSIMGSARFVSDEVLWSDTIESRSESAIAHLNRGVGRTTRAILAIPTDGELLKAGIDDLKRGVELAQRTEIRAKGSLALVEPLRLVGDEGGALRRVDDALELVSGIDTAAERRFRGQALFARGSVEKSLGNFTDAADDFSFAASLVPSYNAHYEAGVCYSLSNQFDDAREALRAAAERDRRAVAPWIALGNLEARTRNPEAAKAALEEASARDAASADVAEAWAEFWLGGERPNWQKAKRELERINRRDSRRKQLTARIDARRALYLFRRGDTPAAVQAADDARDAGVRMPRTLYELGEVYMAAGRYDAAVHCFRSAAGVLEDRTAWREAVARAQALKAYALVVAGDKKGALRAFEAALGVSPRLIEAGMAPLRGEIEMLSKNANPDVRLMAVAAVAGDRGEGRRAADRLFASDPTGEDLLLGLRMRALLRVFVSQEFEGAEDDLAEVLVQRPGDKWARYRLAQAKMRNGIGWVRTAEAIQSPARKRQGRALVLESTGMLNELLKEFPKFVEARLLLGEAWFSLDDVVGAKKNYQQVRELAPRMKEVYLREAIVHRLVYVKGGSPENIHAGIKILEECLSLDPNYFDALFELGNMYHLIYDRPASGNATSRRSAFVQSIAAYRRAMAVNERAREPREEWARIVLKAAREAIQQDSLKVAHQLLETVALDAADIAELYKERVRLNMHPNFGRRTGVATTEAYKQAYEALQHLEQLAPEDSELPQLRALYQRRLASTYLITGMQWSARAKKARDAALLTDDPEERATAEELAKKFSASRDQAQRLMIEALRAAVEASPEDPENAWAIERLRELAPEFVELDRERARKSFDKSMVLFKQRKFEEAVPGFRLAHRLFQDETHLHFWYALALARSAQLNEGKTELALIANGPESGEFPEAMLELGLIGLVQGSPVAAKAWFTRYIAAMKEAGRGTDPGVAQARKHLARLESEGDDGSK